MATMREDEGAGALSWLAGTRSPGPDEAARVRSTAERIQEAIERAILDGDLPAGSRLDAARLADRLEAPASAVHAALGSLARARLVVMAPDDRCHVRVVDAGEARALCDVRASLELLVGRLAARNASREQVDDLASLVDEMRSAARADDAPAWRRLDWQFHDRLARIAGNAALSACYRMVANEFELFLGRHPDAWIEDLREPTREHRHIVEAIGRRKATRAANLLHEHSLAHAARLWAMTHDESQAGRSPDSGFR